ncbi:MAG: 16S rRNA (guanine(527)-N(7))-methyltransferase RsmG [Bullifex sp.]
MSDLLREGAVRLGLDADDEKLAKLERFISEIELFNPVYHLVSCEGRDELIIRHILDSMAGVPELLRLSGGGPIADLGSGAGFPGIVIAIFSSGPVILVERMKRRADFLRNVILRCNLKNVRVICKDVSEVNEKFPVITCRAFHPVYDIIGAVDSILADGGTFCAYKGRKSYLEAETENLKGFTCTAVPLKVPFLDEERCLALIRREEV